MGGRGTLSGVSATWQHLPAAPCSSQRSQGDLAKCDILVNDVGTNVRARIKLSTDEQYTTMMRTNLDSCFFLCKGLFAQLKACRGAVVNVASVAGCEAVVRVRSTRRPRAWFSSLEPWLASGAHMAFA